MDVLVLIFIVVLFHVPYVPSTLSLDLATNNILFRDVRNLVLCSRSEVVRPWYSSLFRNRFARRNYTPPNQSMQRKLDPGLRLAAPSLSPASSSADLKR